MIDIIVGLIVALAVGSAILYIRKQKKNGAKCMGCPSCGTCSGGCCDTSKKKGC